MPLWVHVLAITVIGMAIAGAIQASGVAWVLWMILFIAILGIILGLRLVRESERAVVERFGKNLLHGDIPYILHPGLNVIIPGVDQVVVRQSTQEQTLKLPEQKILAAGVIWEVESEIYFKIAHVEIEDEKDTWVTNDWDVHKATYGVNPGEYHPGKGILLLAEATLRSKLPEVGARAEEKARQAQDVTDDMRLTAVEAMENSQSEINEAVRLAMNEATSNWGIVITRHVVTKLLPPESIRVQLQAKVEAQKKKEAIIIESQGAREAAINVAEGQKQATILTAEALKQKQVLDAEGEGARLERLAEAAMKPGADKAFDFQIAEEMTEAVASLGEKGNAVIFAPAGLAKLGSLGAAAMKFLPQVKGVSGRTPASTKISPSPPKDR